MPENLYAGESVNKNSRTGCADENSIVKNGMTFMKVQKSFSKIYKKYLKHFPFYVII
jgi:hypothetical protein